MAREAAFAAVDLGAESGRVIVGTLRGGRIEFDPVHRFANVPVRTPDGLHWDVLRLYSEMLHGLALGARSHGDAIIGVGIDSWGVDYGLIDAGGRLMGMPYHYRDARTDGVAGEAAQRVSAPEQYARTGIAQLPINTLYQLLAQRKMDDRTLDLAHALLMMPDLLHYWLTGLQTSEHTIASTSGALGVDGRWTTDLLARLDLPTHIFLPPTPPGTVLGGLRGAVRDECGLRRARVILPAAHDTASAVVAVPAVAHKAGVSHAYISAGTWSLLGLELDHPILSEEARLGGFTHERGFEGTYRFLTNIMGLWLLQGCRRSWARKGREWTYDELSALASDSRSAGVIIDVDDPVFLHPDDMLAAITRHLQSTGQGTVDQPELLVRAILEGLALAYRLGLERAERLAGIRVDTLHLVGGGARNTLLCQLTADACRRPVLAGPVEAAALGNVLAQAMGVGEIRNLAEARSIVRSSADLAVYEPREEGDWDERGQRLRAQRHNTLGPEDPAPSVVWPRGTTNSYSCSAAERERR